MRTRNIIFWMSTVAIFLFEGVVPALTHQSTAAQEAMRELGYPPYFATLLMAFKISGAFVLLLPQASRRLKEWAYAGFTFNFFCAFASLWIVNGIQPATFLPLLFLGVLMTSYYCFHKMEAETHFRATVFTVRKS